MTNERGFTPAWVSPPGDTLADLLEERGWSQAELAKRTEFTRKHVNDLLKGRVAITPETAERLAAVLGVSADFWLQREASYRASLAHQESLKKLSSEKGWLDDLPLHWLKKQAWVEAFSDVGAQVDACLRYFSVASVDAWREQYAQPLVAFRASPKFKRQIGAVASWLRQAELQATSITCAPYNEVKFREALTGLRALTCETDPAHFVPRLRELCADCGVAVVFVPAPPGCPVSGATRWLKPDKALLVLSLRYKTNDHLWFTLFHEAGHLLIHKKKLMFVDGVDELDEDQENQANRFAADQLIPPAWLNKIKGLRDGADVEAIAREIGVASGIVVGRMQHEGWIQRNRLNNLKVTYSWNSKQDDG